MLNTSKKTLLQNRVVDVGVNTHKNAQHSAPLAPHVENEIHSKTKLATQKGQEEVNQKSDFSNTSSNECFIITSRSKKRLAKAFKRPAPSSYTALKLLLSQIPAQTQTSWMNISSENCKQKDRKWHFKNRQ